MTSPKHHASRPNMRLKIFFWRFPLDIPDTFIYSVINSDVGLSSIVDAARQNITAYMSHVTNTEHNHIPGFASDMTPTALPQAGTVPTTGAQITTKGTQGTQNSLRAHRLAQVAQAKREAKLMWSTISHRPLSHCFASIFMCTARI
ncbi:hypothetical protein BGY98DRAFT_1103680 [Russula aff. rugulosa BPL654]|nr:hypothetical protein BGY98DRAFT_1103680 [Russula aff. rugulosa BPL654]